MSEIEKILGMVAEGKISAEDGEKLIKAIRETQPEPNNSTELVQVPEKSKSRDKWKGKIVVEIRSAKGETVKFNLPLKLASLATKMLPKDRLANIEKDGINIGEILSNLSDIIEDVEDDIVNIASTSGDRVRIYVER